MASQAVSPSPLDTKVSALGCGSLPGDFSASVFTLFQGVPSEEESSEKLNFDRAEESKFYFSRITPDHFSGAEGRREFCTPARGTDEGGTKTF